MDIAKEKNALNRLRAFDRMLALNAQAGVVNRKGCETGLDVFKWWMGEDINQLSFFDDEE